METGQSATVKTTKRNFCTFFIRLILNIIFTVRHVFGQKIKNKRIPGIWYISRFPPIWSTDCPFPSKTEHIDSASMHHCKLWLLCGSSYILESKRKNQKKRILQLLFCTAYTISLCLGSTLVLRQGSVENWVFVQ